MARIILTKGDEIWREVALLKEQVTIGRGPHNDIVIDHCAVSNEHAVIVTRKDESFLEDLNSTNGTNVNGQPIRKHFLQDRDIIEIALHKILYFEGPANAEPQSAAKSGTAGLNKQKAWLKILNGPNAGKETKLSKLLTTIGRPDHQVAIICQKRDAYFLTHVKGESILLINDKPIGTQSHQLHHDDLIELGGVRLQFHNE